MHQPALPNPWIHTAPWGFVIAVIVIVIGLRPDPGTVTACGTMLLAAAEAHRRLAK
ncbi:hypothetical protein OG616_32295 [Streptomyces antibioticus]|uniref:hypothetical protein n=1 Tax=Streptomyces antibioticus TaxID=1890 RepID=UPI000A706103|nr:hypothetical protein [Streptomyces antibioticus]MCX5172686.1 hypothetical protein [Streptomyces antibioticus]